VWELGGRHRASLSDGDGQPPAAVRDPRPRIGAVTDDHAVDHDQPPRRHAVDRRRPQPVPQLGGRPAGARPEAAQIADQDGRGEPVADRNQLDPGALGGVGED